jgi:hypothetical protein
MADFYIKTELQLHFICMFTTAIPNYQQLLYTVAGMWNQSLNFIYAKFYTAPSMLSWHGTYAQGQLYLCLYFTQTYWWM